MKALSLNEFMQAAPFNNQELYNCLKLDTTYISPYYQNQMYANFLNQPFTPEMIVKKFKGCGYNDIHHCYLMGNGLIQFDNIIMTIINRNTPLTFPMPRTLSDFINDCQRAGIELEFKEQ